MYCVCFSTAAKKKVLCCGENLGCCLSNKHCFGSLITVFATLQEKVVL